MMSVQDTKVSVIFLFIQYLTEIKKAACETNEKSFNIHSYKSQNILHTYFMMLPLINISSIANGFCHPCTQSLQIFLRITTRNNLRPPLVFYFVRAAFVEFYTEA